MRRSTLSAHSDNRVGLDECSKLTDRLQEERIVEEVVLEERNLRSSLLSGPLDHDIKCALYSA